MSGGLADRIELRRLGLDGLSVSCHRLGPLESWGVELRRCLPGGRADLEAKTSRAAWRANRRAKAAKADALVPAFGHEAPPEGSEALG